LRNDELVFVLMRPDQNVAATKSVLDHDLVRIKQHLKWVSNDAESFNATLLAEAKQQLNARRERIAQVAQSTESLGVPVRRKDSGRDPRLSVPTAAVRPRPAVDKYDVALSFAGEDRDYVEAVATGLRAAGVTVFYDKFVTADLWGKNLADHLADVYKNRSRFVVMFVSKHYVSKPWTTHERRHAQDRALVASQEYILPARFDDTEVPGITSTVGYVSLADLPPDALVDLILTKLKR
jgi:hypothetical protein